MSPREWTAKDRQGLLIIGACVLVIVALVSAQIMLQAAAGRVDPQTLCRTDRPLAGHTIILIDMTDPLTPEELQQLHLSIGAVRSEIPKGAKLSVFVIDDRSADLMSERFCKCNPGDGREANPLWSAPALLAKKWNAAFGAPLDSALKEALKYSDSITSPILESIRYVTERDDFSAKIANRRLVIISDLVQNSELLSMYHGTPSIESFMRREDARELLANLENVAIEVDYMVRPRYRAMQNEQLQRFWLGYFERAGAARPVHFRTIRGSYRARVAVRDPGGADPAGGAPAQSAEATTKVFDRSDLDDFGSAPDPSTAVPTEPAPPARTEAVAVERPLVGDASSTATPPGHAEAVPAAAPAAAPAGAPSPAANDEPYVDEPPTLVGQVTPEYPELARAAGIRGTVRLRALVGTDGRVEEVRVIKGIPSLDASAIAAVKRWTFKPGRANDKPLPVWVEIPVRFGR